MLRSDPDIKKHEEDEDSSEMDKKVKAKLKSLNLSPEIAAELFRRRPSSDL